MTTFRGVRLPYRRLGMVCLALLAWVMWSAAAMQLNNGLLDVMVFVPPSATLGVAAVWTAHAFAPARFSWHRAFIGALVSSALGSPLIAFLVAFSAAWDRVSFPFVFTLGALLAIALGLVVSALGWATEWVRDWRKSDGASGGSPTLRRAHGTTVGRP
jgi:hypothetical protein